MIENKLREKIRGVIKKKLTEKQKVAVDGQRYKFVKKFGKAHQASNYASDLGGEVVVAQNKEGEWAVFKLEEGKITEGHSIDFSKEEMELLHKNGKLEKDGHTYLYNEGKLTEDYKNSEWEVYLKDEKGREKIVKKAKSKRAATILYNRIVKSDDYYEVGMRAIKEGKLTEKQSAAVQRMAKQGMWVVYDTPGEQTIKVVKNERAAKMLVKKLKKSGKYNSPEAKAIKLEGKINEKMDRKKAAIILKQIGGNRFIAMTGAKGFAFSDKYMSFKIGRNSKGINFVRIGHNAKDLYDMEFGFVSTKGIKVKKKVKDVYADMLGQMFKKHTGMNVRL